MIEDIRDVIDPQQFGSLKGISTTYCLLDLVHNWMMALDNPGNYLKAVFLDFSKAFDRINHNFVVQKLINIGVRRSIIPWICNFLTCRRQAVKIGSTISQSRRVPQGTKLGPIIFLLMINDLNSSSPTTSNWKYVDDITISEVVPVNGNSVLQLELDNINSWT